MRINAGELALCESSESTCETSQSLSCSASRREHLGQRSEAWRDTFKSLFVIIQKRKSISAVPLIQLQQFEVTCTCLAARVL
jgi:hypothetical protein